MSDVYEKAGQAFLTRKMDWETDEVRAVMVTKDYVPSLTKDEFLSDIPVKARVAVSPPLRDKVAKGFMCRAAPLLMERLLGPSGNAVVLFHNTKNEKTSRLIAYVDDADFLPFTPNGGDLEIGWDQGNIFSL